MGRTLASRLVMGLTVLSLGLTSVVGAGEKKKGPTEGELVSLAGLMGMLSENPKDVQLGSLLYNLGQMGHEKEVAREGATNVNIYNQSQISQIPENVVYFNGKFRPASGYVWKNSDDVNNLRVVIKKKNNIDENRFIVYHKFVDLDSNGKRNLKKEFFGLGKRVFNLDKDRMVISFRGRNYHGDVNFRSWTTTGKLLGETKMHVHKHRFIDLWTGPNVDTSQEDYIDKIKMAGPGDYILTANTDDGKTYMLNISIIKGKEEKEK